MTRRAATPQLPPLTDAERLDYFQAYLNIPVLHGKPFEYWIADPSARICLKNTAHAMRQAFERKKNRAANEPFELTP